MKIYSLIFALLFTNALFSQDSEEKLVEETVNQLFDGMKKSNGNIVKNLFHSDASLSSIYTDKEGNTIKKNEELDGFITAISTPHAEMWDERISNLTVEIDENLAIAWMDYSFFIDSNFSHCGVNSFQLIKIENEWKILSIIDTRRRNNCN